MSVNLRNIPVDVLVGHILPLLGKQSNTELIDKWADDIIEWSKRYKHTKLRDIPGFVPGFHDGKFTLVSHGDDFELYCIYASPEIIPYSIFRKLAPHEDSVPQDFERYQQLIVTRRSVNDSRLHTKGVKCNNECSICTCDTCEMGLHECCCTK